MAVIILVLLAASGCSSKSDLQLFDLEGVEVDLSAYLDELNVFFFIATDCPISNRYAPEIQRLTRRFRSEDVRFFLVYPDGSKPLLQIRNHWSDYGYETPALIDPRRDLVGHLGVEVTPEVAVVSAGELLYRGRIDDRWIAFGKARPRATTRDLEQVLQTLASGHNLDPLVTEAIGCYISDSKWP